MTTYNGFTLGPYDEILPPPLVGDGDEQEALEFLKQDSERRGTPLTLPSRGQSLKGMYNLATMVLHGERLKQAMRGDYGDDPDRQALHEAVVNEGYPISLRPLFNESLYFLTFAPVLRRIEDNRWRVGLPDQGHNAVVMGDPGAVLERAWQLYVEWCDEEATRFKEIVERLLQGTPYSLNHDYWGALLRAQRGVNIAQTAALEWMGKHQTFRLTTPRGARIFGAGSPERAARIGEAIARQMKVEVLYPQAGEMLKALADEGQAPTLNTEGVWVLGDSDIRARWEGNGRRLAVIADRTGVTHAGRGYVLIAEKNTLELMEANGGTAKKPIAVTAMIPNLASSLAEDAGKAVILWWAKSQLAGKKDADE